MVVLALLEVKLPDALLLVNIGLPDLVELVQTFIVVNPLLVYEAVPEVTRIWSRTTPVLMLINVASSDGLD